MGVCQVASEIELVNHVQLTLIRGIPIVPQKKNQTKNRYGKILTMWSVCLPCFWLIWKDQSSQNEWVRAFFVKMETSSSVVHFDINLAKKVH